MQFRAGDLWLEDAPQSGRPVEVDSDQIATLIENNRCSTAREIANIFTKSIKLLVKMKNVSFILLKKNIGTFWPTQYMHREAGTWLPSRIPEP